MHQLNCYIATATTNTNGIFRQIPTRNILVHIKQHCVIHYFSQPRSANSAHPNFWLVQHQSTLYRSQPVSSLTHCQLAPLGRGAAAPAKPRVQPRAGGFRAAHWGALGAARPTAPALGFPLSWPKTRSLRRQLLSHTGVIQ